MALRISLIFGSNKTKTQGSTSQTDREAQVKQTEKAQAEQIGKHESNR